MKRSKITRAMDYLDDDLIAEAAQEKAGAQPVQRERKAFFRNTWARVAAVAAAVVLLLTGGITAANLIGKDQTLTVVAFDVNPSLEIEVDAEEKVVAVNALNEDAKIVVGDRSLKDVSLDVAVDALVRSMLQHGYLSVEQNSILISVSSKDSDKTTTLRKDISDSVVTLLLGNDIQASVITQSFDRKKGQSGASSAKTALINKVVSAGLTRSDGSKYTYGQLVNLSVNELKLMLESKGFSASDLALSGKASESKYIGRERALAIAFEHAGVTTDQVEDLEVELDFEDDLGAMLYEVEFLFGGFEYEYELNAVTGAIVDYEREKDD